MNLSPEWRPFLEENGFEAVHWSVIGDGNASDETIMQWARDHEHVVLTHDLDFGALLAHTRKGGPSVIQVRTQDVSPKQLGPLMLGALRAHQLALASGALITIDESKSRVRILPI